MLQGIIVKKVLDLVMKQILKQFKLDKIQKYVEEPNELDRQVKSLQKDINKYGKYIEEADKDIAILKDVISGNKSMKKKLDNIHYKTHKKCFDCVVLFEHKLKVEGLFEKYRKALHNKNIDAFLNDYEEWANEAIDSNNEKTTFYTEHGDEEKWSGGQSEKQLKEQIKKDIEQVKKFKK